MSPREGCAAAPRATRSPIPSAATSRARSSSRSPPRRTRRRGAKGWGASSPPIGSSRTSETRKETPMRTISVFAACMLAAGSAGAQDLFDYGGPDRMQKIATAAKKEGSLTMYTTFAERDQPTLIKPFEAKYGVKVNVWRAGTDKVLQRTLAEASARKYNVDVIHFGSPEMEALSREKILQAVNSPVHRDLQPGSVPAHREW